MNTPAPRNLSLRKKSSARMAAVQCLYQGAVMETLSQPDALLTEFTAQLKDAADAKERDFGLEVEPNVNYLRDVVQGVCANLAAVDENIAACLTEEQKKLRTNPLMQAVLRAATYELWYNTNFPKSAAVDEYSAVAAAYFADPELGFMHALLNALAARIRA